MQMNSSMNWQGRMLGRYQMLQMLGKGGMGEVWLAEDTQLRRRVAVKLLPAVLSSDESYLHAFAYEARVAAALEHPHILPVHDFGEQRITADEIVTYLVMPYMNGGSLRERIQSSCPLAVDESLRYLRQAAQAIDYAHGHGVLHRDIKPANMLLQQEWLFIADFGIAKLLTGATQQSRTHRGAGTPEYMAPEQAQGHAEPASDRYSLAMTAYQLFTATLPFRGDTPYNILFKQMTEAPPPPRQFNPALPQMVEDVLLQGLAKNPAQRPPSAVAFVDALERGWRNQAPLDPEATLLAPWSKRLRDQMQPPPSSASSYPAPPAPPVQQLPLATPRQPVAELMTQGQRMVPVTPRGESFTTPDAQTQSPQSLPSDIQIPVTQQQKVSRRGLLIGGMATVAVLVAGGATAGYYALQHAKTTTPPAAKPLPGPQKLVPGIPIVSLTGHSRPVWNAAWSPNGRYLATAGEDNTVMLWDVGSYIQAKSSGVPAINKPLRSWRLANQIYADAVNWSHDGRALAAVDIEQSVYVIDALGSTKQPAPYFDIDYVNGIDAPDYLYVAWSPINNTFATSTSSNQQVQLWPLQKFERSAVTVKKLNNDKGPQMVNNVTIGVENLTWSPDGASLASITDTFTVVIWDMKRGQVKSVLTLPQAPGIDPKQQSVFTLRSAIQWSLTNAPMLMTSNIDVISIWDVQHKVQRKQLGTDDPPANTPPPKNTTGIKWTPNVTGINWSPNGRYVAGGYGRSNHIYVWDLQAKAPRMSKAGVQMQQMLFGDTNGHSDTIIDVRWSPDGRYIATSSFDTTVIIWKVDAG